MLRYRVPPGYRRAHPVRCPKLDGFTGVIDQILGDDQQRPKKQRHTAKRIWERLRAGHAFTGGYTIVKDYVRAQTLGGQEMFVPLAHPPGDAQAGFGEAWWSSPVSSARRTIWSWICRTATMRSSRPFRP